MMSAKNAGRRERLMRRWILLIGLIALFLLPARALAWNNAGHMIVALIAWRDLSPEQQKQVAEVMKALPHYKQLVLDTRPADAPEAEWAFMKFATWPDWVRPPRQGDLYKSPAITRYHRGPWHYVDIPYYLGGYNGPPTRPATRADGPTSAPYESALTALPLNHHILADAKAKTEDRAVALAWLEHLTGDLHQPCHAATMYSERFPTGDRGANDQMVQGPNGPQRLHAYWDDLMGTDLDYAVLNAVANELASRKIENLDTRLRQSYGDWAQESHDYAVTTVYLNGELKTALSKDWDEKKIK